MGLYGYLRNVFVAATGRNPYRVEIEGIKRQLKDAVAAVGELEGLYKQVMEERADAEARIGGLQNLTETLRMHLSDKDALLQTANEDVRTMTAAMNDQKQRYENAVNTMRQQHKLKLEEYEAEAAQLREDRDYALERLQEVQQNQARECMANIMLERTNHWLDDLYVALLSGDTDEVSLVGERDDLGSRQAKIAQQCVAILRREKELEARLGIKNPETPR